MKEKTNFDEKVDFIKKSPLILFKGMAFINKLCRRCKVIVLRVHNTKIENLEKNTDLMKDSLNKLCPMCKVRYEKMIK